MAKGFGHSKKMKSSSTPRVGKPWRKGDYWYVYLHKTVHYQGRTGKFRLKLKALDGRWE